MMNKDFLLEIGIEELPARFVPLGITQLGEIARELLGEERLPCQGIKVYGTPRRLAILVEGLDPVQETETREVRGPAAKVAFDEQGTPTKAAEGFARSQGVQAGELVVKSDSGGDYVYAVLNREGSPAMEVLPALIQTLVARLNFPRPMRWGSGETRFARPVRWLVALYGNEVIPVEIAGVAAGRRTRGHRILAPSWIPLKKPGEYVAKLAGGFVMVDRQERRREVWRQAVAMAADEGAWVAEDEELLDEVTDLLEYPTALVGTFPPEYLELPEEVLVTTMREHQRYFPIRDGSGNLKARFIALRNGDDEQLEKVRQGNEKVLKARLADAGFFYCKDTAQPLESNLNLLNKVVFMEKLGDMYQKTERLEVLVEHLATCLGFTSLAPVARRAARLCKADLVSSMVYEFPELQGIMGGHYAAWHGEDEQIWKAVADHYRPGYAGDGLPRTIAGNILALADKLDTLVGCFAVGIQPTGSQDPYALRRQALGILNILLDGHLHLGLTGVIDYAYGVYPSGSLTESRQNVKEQLLDFLRGRLSGILADDGISYDTVAAVLNVVDDPYDIYLRARALQGYRQHEDFVRLMTSFNRAFNLSRHAKESEIKEEFLVEGAEKNLYYRLLESEDTARGLLAEGRYREVFKTVASMAPEVDAFFDAVLVMAPDEALRANRLALLGRVAALSLLVANLEKIVL